MESGGGIWHGMTIRDILEKVDLFNITTVEESNADAKEKNMKEFSPMTLGNYETSEDGKTIVQVSDPRSAYLGPKLWNKPISLPDLMEDDEPSDVMNMEEFLAENNLQFDIEPLQSPMWAEAPVSPPTQVFDIKPQPRPSIIVAPKREPVKAQIALPKGDNTFLYVESKRARIEREKEERRKKFEIEMDFAPEDLALATVPGMDFDPKHRAFDLEELRPQPIIRKRKKTTVPEEMKDDKYWDKRIKNKVATRRSREARRLKENQIALRAAFLEKENTVMKQELETSSFEKTKLKTEIEILKQKLMEYEPKSSH
eukprot:GFUD01039052.1.p1 GENE.GFUD01039052.1~~GFUD01039052.1.p1  ORF type:complete len:313 (+),score=101.17 GFUD01039052.1:47-985(+)